MRNWKGLLWDDDPSDYLETLMDRLEDKVGATLELTRLTEDCYQKFLEEGPWDFIMLDVIDDTSNIAQPNKRAGLDLAVRIRRKAPRIPIIFLTHDADEILVNERMVEKPLLVRTKGTPIGSMVNDIFDFLTEELEPFSRTKVFLIYGHGRKAGGFREKVERSLKEVELDLVVIRPEMIMTTLSLALVEQMADCGAIVAICTPDDQVGEDWWQPRQNVLLEIGIAMGLNRGFERLILLQRWGSEEDCKAKLPSDLGGILPIRFFDDVSNDAIEKMLTALRERGMDLKDA